MFWEHFILCTYVGFVIGKVVRVRKRNVHSNSRGIVPADSSSLYVDRAPLVSERDKYHRNKADVWSMYNIFLNTSGMIIYTLIFILYNM